MPQNTLDAAHHLSAPNGRKHEEMVPKRLINASIALILVSLLITAYSVVSGRERAGTPKEGHIDAMAAIKIVPGTRGSALVYDAESDALLVSFDEGEAGFMGSLTKAIHFARKRANAPLDAPLLLLRYADGRHVLHDPNTDQKYHLRGFGAANLQAFADTLLIAEGKK